MKTPDQHGNFIAEEGCDRCTCGCKYWENDRCTDCGTHVCDAARERGPEPDPWEDDAVHSGEDWRYEVANGDTRLGYREWVEAQRANEGGTLRIVVTLANAEEANAIGRSIGHHIFDHRGTTDVAVTTPNIGSDPETWREVASWKR